jgi:hypothetical protein
VIFFCILLYLSLSCLYLINYTCHEAWFTYNVRCKSDDILVYDLMGLLLCDVDLKSALGKKRRDGKSAPLEPLTKVQRICIGRLIEKYGDNYKV